MSEDSALPPFMAPRARRAHRRRPGPDDPLCSCGRLRDACVRVAVRAVWSDPEPATGRAHPGPAAVRSVGTARLATTAALAARTPRADPVDDRDRLRA